MRIFVGGTGRSGATISGTCLEELPDTIYFVEPGLLICPKGLKDYLRGKVRFEGFKDTIITKYREKLISGFSFRTDKHCKYYNIPKNFYKKEDVECIVDKYKIDKDNAAFFEKILDIALKEFKCTNYIYKMPHLICNIDLLDNMFGEDYYFIHVIREPKDVFYSVLEYKWGPNNLKEFIYWYNKIMGKALDQYKNFSKNYLVIFFENLVNQPIETFDKIYSFLQVKNGKDIRTKAITHLLHKKAHIGRYKKNGDDLKDIDNNVMPLYREWKKLV